VSESRKPPQNERFPPVVHLRCKVQAKTPRQYLEFAFRRWVPNPDWYLGLDGASGEGGVLASVRVLKSAREPDWAEVEDLVRDLDISALGGMPDLVARIGRGRASARRRGVSAVHWRMRVDDYVAQLRRTEPDLFEAKRDVISRVQNWAATLSDPLVVSDKTIENHIYELLA
jgi:hypothetical protein